MARSLPMALAALCCLTAPCLALSETPAEVPVVYEADPGCPGHERLMEQLRARTSHARTAQPGDSSPIRVTARVRDGAAIGRIEVTLPSGALTGREVKSDSCEGVVSAVALVLAMMLETDPTFSGVASSAPVCPSSPAPQPSAPAPPPRPYASEPIVPPPVVQAPRASGWSIGVRARAMTAVSPALLLASEQVVEAPTTSGSVLRRIIRASVLYGASLPRDTEPRGRTDLVQARLAACPLAVNPTSSLLLAACAEVGIGAISVRGEAARPVSATLLWSDVALTGLVDWSLAPTIRLELMGGALAPLTRYVFEVTNPYGVYHSVPRVGVTGGLAFIFALP